jgi:hypothetical protein
VSRAIPQSRWKWFGCPGHFIGWRSCHVRLHTRVGDYRISTVGAYFPTGMAQGHFDQGEEIGLGRRYETYVFRVEGHGEHGEGVMDSGLEIDSLSADTEAAATENHMAMCRKWARA